MAVFISAVSCNSKETEEDNQIAVTPALVAVKNFYLKANDSILSKLDSVFFSIDLDNGVIFNADSLPKGTDVSKLVPSITFANTMKKAELTFMNGAEKKTSDYLTNPDDTINFSSTVLMDVTAEDGINSFTYHIKVNVHQTEPDTLIWDKLAVAQLPNRFPAPVAQKTVTRNDIIYTLIEEFNGEYTLAVSADLKKGDWDSYELNFDFTPLVNSFTAGVEQLWILSEDGELFSSENGEDWISTGENWVSILGAYQNHLLGIKLAGEQLVYTQFPTAADYVEKPVPDNFPVYNSTQLGIVRSDWYPLPFALLAGGMTFSGDLSNNVWGFDGETWTVINNGELPALDLPMLARYVVFRETPSLFTQRELDVWLLFGGSNIEGEMNREVYLSYDNGVNWKKASDMMQLPPSFPSLMGANVVVADYDLTADLSEAWTLKEGTKSSLWTRASYTIDGFDITWSCPYLYIFGGYGSDEVLSTDIWRGVIARLEFVPNI